MTRQWWFTSTAVPLLAATLGPLANVLSIGAIITSWRVDRIDPTNPNGDLLPPLEGIPIHDPTWCYWINLASLILGFVGNFFLLLNFTGRIRYIISLPMTVLLWFLACGFVSAFHNTLSPEGFYSQSKVDRRPRSAASWCAAFVPNPDVFGRVLVWHGRGFDVSDSFMSSALKSSWIYSGPLSADV
jgi:hypothetical protein